MKLWVSNLYHKVTNVLFYLVCKIDVLPHIQWGKMLTVRHVTPFIKIHTTTQPVQYNNDPCIPNMKLQCEVITVQWVKASTYKTVLLSLIMKRRWCCLEIIIWFTVWTCKIDTTIATYLKLAVLTLYKGLSGPAVSLSTDYTWPRWIHFAVIIVNWLPPFFFCICQFRARAFQFVSADLKVSKLFLKMVW